MSTSDYFAPIAPVPRSVCAVLVAFLLAPKIGVLDLSVIALIIGFLVHVRRIALSRDVAFLVIIFTIIFVLVLLSGMANQIITFENLLKPIRNFLLILLLYSLLQKQALTLDKLFDVLIFAGMINSIVVLLQVIFTLIGLDDAVLRFYPPGETIDGLRKPGLSSGYPSSGLLSCIAAVVALYKYCFNADKRYFWLLLMCLPGVFLSARTAVVLFFVAFGLAILIAFVNRNLRFLAHMGGLAFILISLVGALFAYDPKIYDIFYVMFEFVFVYLDEGSVGVRSTDDLLQNHFFLPRDLVEWLVGNGRAAWGLGGIESDVWFTQNLVGSGVFVMSLYLIAFGFIWWSAIKATMGFYRLTVFYIFLMVFIASFKGSFIFSRFVGDAATLLGVWSLVYINRKRLNNH